MLNVLVRVLSVTWSQTKALVFVFPVFLARKVDLAQLQKKDADALRFLGLGLRREDTDAHKKNFKSLL